MIPVLLLLIPELVLLLPELVLVLVTEVARCLLRRTWPGSGGRHGSETRQVSSAGKESDMKEGQGGGGRFFSYQTLVLLSRNPDRKEGQGGAAIFFSGPRTSHEAMKVMKTEEDLRLFFLEERGSQGQEGSG